MKIYFVFNIVLLINFSNGVPLSQNSEQSKHNDHLVQEKYCNVLESEGLEDFCPSLKEILERISGIQDLVNDKITEYVNLSDEMQSELKSEFSKFDDCVKTNLNPAMENFNQKSEEILKMIDESPESETCYTDLLKWIEDLKTSNKQMWLGNAYYMYSKELLEYHAEFSVALEERNEDFEEALEKVQESLERVDQGKDKALETYTNMMIDVKRKNENKTHIWKTTNEMFIKAFKKEMDKFTSTLNNKFDEIFGAMEEIYEEYFNEIKESQKSCSENSLGMTTTAEAVESIVKSYTNDINFYASCDIFIIEENKEEMLGCEEHVPYFGQEPGEKVKAITISDRNSTYTCEGIDGDGRKYTRVWTRQQIDEKTVNAEETIHYLEADEFVNKKYVYKCK